MGKCKHEAEMQKVNDRLLKDNVALIHEFGTFRSFLEEFSGHVVDGHQKSCTCHWCIYTRKAKFLLATTRVPKHTTTNNTQE